MRGVKYNARLVELVGVEVERAGLVLAWSGWLAPRASAGKHGGRTSGRPRRRRADLVMVISEGLRGPRRRPRPGAGAQAAQVRPHYT